MSSEPWLSCKKSNRYRSCWASPGPPRAGSLGSSKVFAAHNCISSVAGVEMMLRLRAALAGRIMPDDSLISGIIYIYICSMIFTYSECINWFWTTKHTNGEWANSLGLQDNLFFFWGDDHPTGPCLSAISEGKMNVFEDLFQRARSHRLVQEHFSAGGFPVLAWKIS